jgi:hypothetical protein
VNGERKRAYLRSIVESSGIVRCEGWRSRAAEGVVKGAEGAGGASFSCDTLVIRFSIFHCGNISKRRHPMISRKETEKKVEILKIKKM